MIRIIGLNGLHTFLSRPFINGKIGHHFEGKGVFPFRRSWALGIDREATRKYYQSLIKPYQDEGPHVLVGFSAGGRLVQCIWDHENCIGSVLHGSPEEYVVAIPKGEIIVYHAHNDRLVPAHTRLKSYRTFVHEHIYESNSFLGHGFEEVEQLKTDMTKVFEVPWDDFY